ncbi:hypothetical protein RF11_13988 [Thelohanellus kitauei]|uniref:Uncharacterized protein n=1 Tax=Thelohanellus kitauei TaxID=669202 RepID=A0A0C2M9L7_THEKT|nr:hypothetical protein RF11_13988 [Thelohanellus kitauei]
MHSLCKYRTQPEFIFLYEVLNVNKKPASHSSGVNASNEAYNIYGYIEAGNFNSVIEFLMMESKQKIMEVASVYYKTFGLSIPEHACMNHCKAFLLAYIRHTVFSALAPSTYFSLTIGQIISTKRSFNCCLYLLLCALEFGAQPGFETFKEYYNSSMFIRIKQYLPSYLHATIENLFKAYDCLN